MKRILYGAFCVGMLMFTAAPAFSFCGDAFLEMGEACDHGGTSGSMGPADCCAPGCVFRSSASTCRLAAGVCDVAENCTGTSAFCPADSRLTSVCRPQNGACDASESCDGIGNFCPADQFFDTNTECRPAAGGCDPAEKCTGTSSDCPTDVLSPAGAVCRVSSGVCDPTETCNGVAPSCPSDSILSSSTVCRAAQGICDLEETCTGTSGACPVDARSTSTCRPQSGVCDDPETCDGIAADCPVDELFSAGVVCRASLGACDPAEFCDGISTSCPSNVTVADGTGCPSDGNPCTDDVCGGGVCGVDNSASLCADSDLCTKDTCDPMNGCEHEIAPQDDEDCLLALKAKFSVSDSADPLHDKLSWSWSSGEAFDQSALGDPLVDTKYALCVYDMTASAPSLAAAVVVDAGPLRWTSKDPKGLKYKDSAGTFDGATNASLKTGLVRKTKAKFKAAKSNLTLPGPAGATYFDQDPKVVVQLINSAGTCWTSEFNPAQASENDTDSFKAQVK